MSPLGMTGLDSVILVLFAAIRDRIGSRYPLDATIIAETSVIGRAVAKMKFNFVPAYALAA